MLWYKKAGETTDPWDRHDISLEDLEANSILEWWEDPGFEDVPDWRGEHSTRPTGRHDGGVRGMISLKGVVHIPVERISHEYENLTGFIRYTLEQDPPRMVMRMIDDEVPDYVPSVVGGPADPGNKWNHHVKARKLEVNKIDTDLYQVEAELDIDFTVSFEPTEIA